MTKPLSKAVIEIKEIMPTSYYATPMVIKVVEKLGLKISILEQQIEEMKNCYNCKYHCTTLCVTCIRSWPDMTEDNWELKDKDND